MRRRHLLAEWMREVSALLVVFPVVDQLVDASARANFSAWVAGCSLLVGLTFLTLGVEWTARYA